MRRQITFRHVVYALLGFAAVQAAGTIGYALLLDEGVVDAFYRTVVTVSTVGLATIPHGAGVRLFTVVLVVAGVALFLYVIGLVIELTVSGVVSGARLERRTRRGVERLEGHYLICGYGRVGRRVAEEFRAADAAYVVVDESSVAAAAARGHTDLVVEGSATDDEVLQRAGIGRAQGLVACVDSDAENLYIVLSARELRPNLLIVARASSEDAATKLRRGGADRVVTPYAIAGRELATLVLRPQVSAFLDVVSSAGGPEFRFEQVEVTAGSGQAGKSIRELRIREETGAMIIAHKQRSGAFNTRPDPDARLGDGDVLIAVGTPDEIRALEDLFRPREAVA